MRVIIRDGVRMTENDDGNDASVVLSAKVATDFAAGLFAGAGVPVAEAAIARTTLSDTPVYSAAAGAALEGTSGASAARAAAVAAALADTDPSEDMRGPVEFKKHVAGVILRRAIDRAIERAA